MEFKSESIGVWEGWRLKVPSTLARPKEFKNGILKRVKCVALTDYAVTITVHFGFVFE